MDPALGLWDLLRQGRGPTQELKAVLEKSLVLGDSRKSVSHFLQLRRSLAWVSLFSLFWWLHLCPIGKLVYLSLPASRANFHLLTDYADLSYQRLGFHLSQHMIALPRRSTQDFPAAS